MSVALPNGATIAIAASYGTTKQMTALTNATEGVATLEASHGIIVGDVFELTSGWSRLTDRIVRAKTVSTDDVTLEGVNTSDTTLYPAGTGTGSIREVLTWQQIQQVLDANTAGGEQQFTNYSFLEDAFERQIPTNRSPQSITLQIADDTTLPHYNVLATADDDRKKRAIRIVLPGGSVLYYNAYVSMNRTPSLTKNQVMALTVNLSLLSQPTRY
jgi:hypothetical protein